MNREGVHDFLALPLSSQVTFGASYFLFQPLKKSFEIGSILKTSKKDDNSFRFKVSYVLE